MAPTAGQWTWNCDDGQRLVLSTNGLEPGGDIIRLNSDSGELVLARVRTASGVKHQAGEVSFWSKGTEAMYERGEVLIRCQLNQEEAGTDVG